MNAAELKKLPTVFYKTKPQQTKLSSRISHLHPCADAVTWLDKQKSPAQAWRDCERGEWMLWILGTQSGKVGSAARRKLVACAADCAALALPIFEKRYPNNKRVRKCIEACRAYARGEISEKQLRIARRDAAVAAYAAAAAAAYAADAADAYAADAAAADAAVAAYAAAAAADAADARSNVLAQCAKIVRKHYPKLPKIARPT